VGENLPSSAEVIAKPQTLWLARILINERLINGTLRGAANSFAPWNAAFAKPG
jgi:hypothetical protein